MTNLTNKKVAYLSLGCKVNSYETEAMRELLTSYGTVTVDFKEIADIYVVNTCTVTNIADRKSRQVLHRAKKQSPDATVVAVGCYVQKFYENHRDDSSIDLLIGNRRKNQIASILEEYFQAKEEGRIPEKVYVNDDKELNEYEPLSIRSTTEHTRAYMKIQDGCNQFCSYCIIPYARGRIKSRSLESIRKEAESLAKDGFKEVVLTGIHISSYGLDQASKEEQKALRMADGTFPLLDVIRVISEIPEIQRIRLGSLEPRIITEEFCKALSQYEKVCPHFHLSLQSGCDKTLQAMNRKYTTEMYKNGVELLRKNYELPGITTDIIVGFPGENDVDFMTTLEFAKTIGFSKIHIFPYSRRKGTVADKLPDQVPEDRKKKRAQTLSVQESLLEREYRKQLTGRSYPVLFEESVTISGETYWIGHIPQYVLVAVKDSVNAGDIRMVTITESDIGDYPLGKC